MEEDRPNQPEPREKQSPEQRLVADEIRRSLEQIRDINDTAARILASWYHGGQTSPLYSFQSSGAIDADGLIVEMLQIIHDDELDPSVRVHMDALGSYFVHAPDRDERGNRGAVAGWHESTKDWGDRPAADDGEVQDGGDPVPDPDVYAAYLEYFGEDEDSERDFPERYLGTFDTPKAYADHLVDELDYQRHIDDMLIDDGMKKYVYFDTEAWAHDLWVEGQIVVLQLDDGRVAIFNNRTV